MLHIVALVLWPVLFQQNCISNSIQENNCMILLQAGRILHKFCQCIWDAEGGKQHS